VIREYVHFLGDAAVPETVAALAAEGELDHLTMPDEWYVENGRALDLVASYLPRTADLAGWLTFLDTLIDRYGHLTRYLQVTLEPNFPIPLIDGSSPGVLEALTLGIPHARAALNRKGLGDVLVGFSVAEPPEWLGGDDAFWLHLAMTPARDFAVDVDYVGLASLTAHALRHLRDRLPQARIPASVPIHIVENGSPSGAPRTEHDQAESLSDMIQTVLAHRDSLNVTQYELFSLRDADSGSPEPLGSLGLVTDTYERKAAFDTYREMIRSHSGRR
jgi:hypothetical protein